MWLLRKLRWKILLLVATSVYCSIVVLLAVRMHHGTENARSLLPERQAKAMISVTNGRTAKYTSSEVNEFIEKFSQNYKSTIYVTNAIEPYETLLKRLHRWRKNGSYFLHINNTKSLKSWQKFHNGINQYFLYNPYDGVVDELLKDLSTRPIVKAERKIDGSQLKLTFTFDDGARGIFKPMRMARDQETKPDHFYFDDYERHNAEIAAFHLDKVLGYNRTPPSVGRVINITEDIIQVNRSGDIHTFRSPAGNVCFYGNCFEYCGSANAVCGQPDLVEGSISILLPYVKDIMCGVHPWKPPYKYVLTTIWDGIDDYCNTVRNDSRFKRDRLLMDIIDLSIIDFLTGNMDRHEYEEYRPLVYLKDVSLVYLDHGRGFGKSKYDCITCLAPLVHCRNIRLSTLAKLVKLYQGPDSLSQVLRESMKSDPLSPVLWETHLEALDRRLWKILTVLYDIIKQENSWDKVVIHDQVM